MFNSYFYDLDVSTVLEIAKETIMVGGTKTRERCPKIWSCFNPHLLICLRSNEGGFAELDVVTTVAMVGNWVLSNSLAGNLEDK